MSWGTTSNAYTYSDVQVDMFMHDNPKSIIVVSVGNSGGLGPKTVYSPSLSKNCIGVGSSNSVNPRGREINRPIEEEEKETLAYISHLCVLQVRIQI